MGRSKSVGRGGWIGGVRGGWVFVLLAPLGGACLDAREGHSGAPAGGDTATTGGPEVVGVEAETTPPQAVDPVVVSVEPGLACAPSAIAFEFAVPEIPPEAKDREACPVASVTTETSGDAGEHYVNRTDYNWEGDTLTIAHSNFVLRYAFAPDGELARFERTYLFAAATEAVDFLPGGRVASVWHGPVGGALTEVIHQEWSADGQLVARTELFTAQSADAPFGPSAEVLSTWDYDAAGRLVGARTTFGPHAAEVRWTYAGGFPTRVVRTREGVVVEDQRWTWDAAGALVTRAITRAVSGDAFGAGYPYTSYFLGSPRVAPLDDAEVGAAVARDWRANPWNAAPAHDAGSTCQRRPRSGCPSTCQRRPRSGCPSTCQPLPTGFGHGYPATETHYDLGWPRDERPSGVGFAYGADVYAYDYGDLAWFGHEGADGGLGTLSIDLVYRGAGEAVVDYENGQMVRQVLRSSAPDLGDFEATRERVFEAREGVAGAGLLVSDRLAWTSRDTGATGERELIFSYGDDGRLARRELADAPHGLVAFQTWAWDPAGHVTEHLIARGIPARLGGWSVDPRAPEVTHRYERTYDAAGHLVRDAEFFVQSDGGEDVEEHVRVFEGERLVSETNPGEDITYTYDSAGRLGEEVHRYRYAQVPPVEAVQRVTYAYDAEGRLMRMEDRLSGAYPRVVIETRAYACAAP